MCRRGARAVVLQDGLFDASEDGLVRLFGGVLGRRGHRRIVAFLVGRMGGAYVILPTKTHSWQYHASESLRSN